jgi:4-alpha-glucanotransferase
MSFSRAAGILLHPTSLPSRGGVGDFGPAAYRFADFLASARQGIWQVLPLGPLGYGNSPYSATSAFAGNPLLISLERQADHGWMAAIKSRVFPPVQDLSNTTRFSPRNFRSCSKPPTAFCAPLQAMR